MFSVTEVKYNEKKGKEKLSKTHKLFKSLKLGFRPGDFQVRSVFLFDNYLCKITAFLGTNPTSTIFQLSLLLCYRPYLDYRPCLLTRFIKERSLRY